MSSNTEIHLKDLVINLYCPELSPQDEIKFVKEHDHKLDKRALKDFLDFVGHTQKEFWQVVENFYNKDIFKKVNGQWRLKNPIYKDLKE